MPFSLRPGLHKTRYMHLEISQENINSTLDLGGFGCLGFRSLMALVLESRVEACSIDPGVGGARLLGTKGCICCDIGNTC